MKLSQRLSAIEQFVPQDCILADIGCDHAYLACSVVLNGKCLKSYACDVNVGPLKAAQSTIDENGCQNRVIPILSNGLQQVPSDANVCVIAGMGYETIKMILEEGNLEQFDLLILQSNSNVDDLRRYVIESGFNIENETIVHEGHFYTILLVTKGQSVTYSKEDYLFGKYVCENFVEYWTFRLNRIHAILKQFSNDDPHRQQFEELYKTIENKLNSI